VRFPIEYERDLPEPGRANERCSLDFKAEPSADSFEIAKDVAALANAEGGTVLIGAAGKGEFLGSYRPMSVAESSRAQRLYEESIRDRCFPRPLFSVAAIEKDDGIVLALNVWPYPGQLVGVRVVQGEAKCGAAQKQPENLFFFPSRIGSHTTGLTPEQLPMFMDAHTRRIAILLKQAADQSVILRSPQRQTAHYFRPAVVRRVDFLENTLALDLEEEDGAMSPISIPLDHVESAWKDEGRWFLLLRGYFDQWESGPAASKSLPNNRWFF